jgi:hypothetical protein
MTVKISANSDDGVQFLHITSQEVATGVMTTGKTVKYMLEGLPEVKIMYGAREYPTEVQLCTYGDLNAVKRCKRNDSKWTRTEILMRYLQGREVLMVAAEMMRRLGPYPEGLLVQDARTLCWRPATIYDFTNECRVVLRQRSPAEVQAVLAGYRFEVESLIEGWEYR